MTIILSYLICIFFQPTVKHEPGTDDEDEPSVKKSAMQDLFDEIYITGVTPAPVQTSVHVQVEQEILLYKQESSIDLNSNPLNWWKNNETKFPLLAKMA